MRFEKVYSMGKVLNNRAYAALQIQDRQGPAFRACENEFKDNRDWWIMRNKRNEIVAYCGTAYSEGIAIFLRAWVIKSKRGKGLQKHMIKLRLNAAKQRKCRVAITYTMKWNYPSMNNLIGCGFKIYGPSWEYGGKEMIYFKKTL